MMYRVGDIVRDTGIDLITGAKIPPTVWRVVSVGELPHEGVMCIEHNKPYSKPIRLYLAELLPPLRLVKANSHDD